MTEQQKFEAWYAEDASKQTGKPGWFTPEEISELRDGDEYGEHRVSLNAKWAGWQARAAQDKSAELFEALVDVLGWFPGRQAWHTDEPIKAVERARAAISKARGE